mgnify:CR=1 FL=1
MRKLIATIAVLLAVGAAFYGVGYAFTQFYKQVAGVGTVEFVDQATVQDVSVIGADKVKVKVQSNSLTEAGYSYTVAFYLDGEQVATQTVSWTAPQIPGVSKNLTFTGLALAPVTQYGVEVRR